MLDLWGTSISYCLEISTRVKASCILKNNIVCDKHKATQVWPEFVVSEGVELEFTLRIIQSGTVDTIIDEINLDQTRLDEPIIIESRPYDVYASVSLKLRGEGQVKVGAIHKRGHDMIWGILVWRSKICR